MESTVQRFHFIKEVFLPCFFMTKGLGTKRNTLLSYRQYTNILYFDLYLNAAYAAHCVVRRLIKEFILLYKILANHCVLYDFLLLNVVIYILLCAYLY